MEPGNEAVDESETMNGHAIKEASCEKNRCANEKGADPPSEVKGCPPRGHEENNGATESPNAWTDHEEATAELRSDASVIIGSAGEQYTRTENV